MLVPWMKGIFFFTKSQSKLKPVLYWLFLTDMKLRTWVPLTPINKHILQYFQNNNSWRIIYSVGLYYIPCNIACYSWHFLHCIICFCRGKEKTACFTENSEQTEWAGREEALCHCLSHCTNMWLPFMRLWVAFMVYCCLSKKDTMVIQMNAVHWTTITQGVTFLCLHFVPASLCGAHRLLGVQVIHTRNWKLDRNWCRFKPLVTQTATNRCFQ